jgi:hypothetical protein
MTKYTGINNSSCLDKFIQNFPKIAHSSKSISKVAMVFGIIASTIAISVCAMMIVNNPNILSMSQWHWTQIAFFSVNAAVGVLSIIIWCFFSCVHSQMREKQNQTSERGVFFINP